MEPSAKKEDNNFLSISLIAIFVIILFTIVFSYLILKDKNNLNNDYAEQESVLSQNTQVKDYFPDVIERHWPQIPITYDYNQECIDWWEGRWLNKISLALGEISNTTNNSISFLKIDSSEFDSQNTPDIMFLCNNTQPHSDATQLSSTYAIAEAQAFYWPSVNLYAPSKVYIHTPRGCYDRPAILMHEVLHLIGLKHTPKTNEYARDIMFPKSVDCNSQISEKDIEFLKNIYTK